MLLDLPANVLYRRGVNLYGAMRVLCTNYNCVIRLTVFLAALAAAALLDRPGMLRLLGVSVPVWPEW